MSSFETLNNGVISHIFSFVGNAYDFLALQATCTEFREILVNGDDRVWEDCTGDMPQQGNISNREKALHNCALEQIRRYQGDYHSQDKSIKLNLQRSYILKILQLQGWRDLLSHFLFTHIMRNPTNMGDKLKKPVLITLALVIECNMIEIVERANLISIHRMKDQDDVLFSIRKDDVLLTERLYFHPRVSHIYSWALSDNFADNVPLTREVKSRLIQAFARTAGVAALEDDGKDRICAVFFGLCYAMLEHLPLTYGTRSERLITKELNSCSKDTIERIAERLCLLTTQVYGVDDGEDESEDDCELCEEEESVSSFSGSSSDESMSSSDDDNGDDMSVYSDNDCPDVGSDSN